MAYIRHQDFINGVGQNIRCIRLSKGISLEQLSYSSELSINQISRIERGEINTSISSLYEIALALNVNVIQLFDFTKENQTK